MNLAVNYKLQRKENDIMKFNDIMLDLDTGDASMHDAYVKAAEGKIDVASAIFEYAQTLQAHAGDDKYIQEAADAADEAGLPSDPSEASGLATAAVQQELAGFYDVFVENAKKVKTAADRDMKAIIGLGKKYGISAAAAQNGKFMITFAKPLAQALVSDCGGKKSSIKFAKGIFPTASKAHDLMFAYGNSMARLAAVFGIDISDVIEDPTVQDELALGFFKKIPQKGFEAGTPDVDALYKNLLKGSNYAKFDTSGKLATATNVDAEDIAEIITYIYVVHQVSKSVASSATGSKKKAAMEFVAKLCGAEEMRHDESNKSGQKKISKKFQRINDNIKGWAEAVSASADLVVKSFSDAVSALGKVATGECAGIKDEGETTTESYTEETGSDFFDEPGYQNDSSVSGIQESFIETIMEGTRTNKDNIKKRIATSMQDMQANLKKMHEVIGKSDVTKRDLGKMYMMVKNGETASKSTSLKGMSLVPGFAVGNVFAMLGHPLAGLAAYFVTLRLTLTKSSSVGKNFEGEQFVKSVENVLSFLKIAVKRRRGKKAFTEDEIAALKTYYDDIIALDKLTKQGLSSPEKFADVSITEIDNAIIKVLNQYNSVAKIVESDAFTEDVVEEAFIMLKESLGELSTDDE